MNQKCTLDIFNISPFRFLNDAQKKALKAKKTEKNSISNVE